MARQNVRAALLAAIAIVAISLAAYLYMDKRASEPVGEDEVELLVDQNLINTELMQESLDARIEGLQQSERERLDSPTGQALMTRCLEWQQLHASHPDAATEINRERACREYQQFVATGELPEADE